MTIIVLRLLLGLANHILKAEKVLIGLFMTNVMEILEGIQTWADLEHEISYILPLSISYKTYPHQQRRPVEN